MMGRMQTRRNRFIGSPKDGIVSASIWLVFKSIIIHDLAGAEKLEVAVPDGRSDGGQESFKEALLTNDLGAFGK